MANLISVSKLITKGTTPTTIGGRFTPTGINFIKSESITGSKFLNQDVYEHIDIETDTKLKRSRLEKDDLLFSIAGAYLGKIAIVQKHDLPANTNQAVAIVRLDTTKVNVDYIYYYFSQRHINNYINQLSSQSSQPNLNLDLLGKLEFDQKDLTCQQKIASVLSSLDAKIELNNRINAQLEAMAKTLYDYWFVQFDFPDENSKPYKSSGGAMEYNPELKRKIPKGWKAIELNGIVEVSNDSINPMDAPDKGFKHYSIPVFDATNSYAVEKGFTIKSNKFTVTENDVLVSKLNPWFSRVVYPLDEEDLVCSTEFVVWRSQDFKIKNFLFITAIQDPFISFCTQSATGTSNSHKRVNPTVMMKYTIAYDQKIAESYGEKVDSVLKKIIKNQAENRQLAELRDWLLPMLMNGQVRVA